ncbi:MAG TPA: PspC domain-containing protein [Candidatus Limnocylindria bacterium]
MTTEQHSTPRRLYRRSDERVIAGVASGLGDYFNVDPLLIRIALVASLVFGGLGIFVYAAAWFLVPEETSDRSAAERLFGGAALGGGLAGGIVVLIGIVVLLSVLGAVLGGMPGDGGAAFVFAVLVVGIGALLLRRGGVSDAPVSAVTATPPDRATAPHATVPGQPVRTAVRRKPRPPSPLGWYVLGAVLVGIGVMALASGAWDLGFTPGTYAGITLAVIGAGLLVGTFWGHARFLIVIGLLILPIAWAASLVSVPLEGGFASQRFTPAAAGAIRDEYRLAGGRLVLDLTRVPDDGEPITVGASVAFGELVVLVPDDSTVDVDASVGGGAMRILGTPHRGTHLEASELIEGDGPHFVLDLGAGIGEIDVATRPSEGR